MSLSWIGEAEIHLLHAEIRLCGPVDDRGRQASDCVYFELNTHSLRDARFDYTDDFGDAVRG